MRKILAVLLAAAVIAGINGCSSGSEHIDLSDPLSGDAIVSAADLEAFLLHGEKDRAVLAASFSMEDRMLILTRERGKVTIDGGGFTLSGTADCIIRMDDGAELYLNNITLHSGSTALGCLGSAELGGSNANIIGVFDGVLCADELFISPGSSLVCTGSNGCGLEAAQLKLGSGASLSGDGQLGGVNVKGGIELNAGASLSAYTDENYNALKCDGVLAMADGSELRVENSGSYHGAEINELDINGAVTINAKGGSEATGLFIFEQHKDIYVIGGCQPEARYENGRGRLKFVSGPSEIPKKVQEINQPAAEEPEKISAAGK